MAEVADGVLDGTQDALADAMLARGLHPLGQGRDRGLQRVDRAARSQARERSCHGAELGAQDVEPAVARCGTRLAGEDRVTMDIVDLGGEVRHLAAQRRDHGFGGVRAPHVGGRRRRHRTVVRFLERALAPRDVGDGIAEAAAPGERRGLDSGQRGGGRAKAVAGARLYRIEDRVELLLKPADRLDRFGSLAPECALARRRLGGAALADGVEPRLEARQRALYGVVGHGGEALRQVAFQLAELARQRRDIAILLLAPGLRVLEQLGHRSEGLIGAPLVADAASFHRGDGILQQIVAVVAVGRAMRRAPVGGTRRRPVLLVEILGIAFIERPVRPSPRVGSDPRAASRVIGGTGTRSHLFQSRGHGIDPLLAADRARRQAMVLGMIGDHAVKPLAEGLALASGGLASRVARVETDAIDVPGLGLVHRLPPAGLNPVSSWRLACASRRVR